MANWPENLLKIQACKTWGDLVELLGEDAGGMTFYILEREIEVCHRRASVERDRNCPNHAAAEKAYAHMTQLALEHLRG